MQKHNLASRQRDEQSRKRVTKLLTFHFPKSLRPDRCFPPSSLAQEFPPKKILLLLIADCQTVRFISKQIEAVDIGW